MEISCEKVFVDIGALLVLKVLCFFKQLQNKTKKMSGLQRDSNPWPLR